MRTLSDLMRSALTGAGPGGNLHIHAGARGRDVEGNFETWSSKQLFARAAAAGAMLKAKGVAPGDICLVCAESIPATLTAFFGALSVGAVPSVQPAAPALRGAEAVARRLDAWCRRLGSRSWVLTESERGTRLAAAVPAAKGVLELDVGFGNEKPLAPDEIHDARPDDPAFLQITSGTTGEGKAVVVPHRAILAEVGGIARPLNWGADTVFSSWAPLHHDMGMVGSIFCPLCVGAVTIVLTPSQFLLAPMNWLRALGAFGVTHICMPDFGYAYCADDAERRGVPDDIDLASLRSAVVSAEPVRWRSLARFTDAFSARGFDPAVVTPAYGMAETTLAASLHPIGKAARYVRIKPGAASAGTPAPIVERGEFDGAPGASAEPRDGTLAIFSNGPPVDGVEIAALDEAGTPMEDGVCGELAISGDIVALGYLEAEGKDIEPFEQGRVRTGDLGFLLDGEVYVVDRLKNVIIRYGGNYAATEIEQALSAAAGIPDSRIMVLEADVHDAEAPIVALVEARAREDTERVVADLRAARARTDLPVDEIWFLRSGTIPKTTSGKKRYAAARDVVQNGALEVRERHSMFVDAAPDEAPPPRSLARAGRAVEVGVAKIVASFARERGRAGEISVFTRLDEDLGLDSLQVFELALTVQAEFDLVLQEGDLIGLETVGQLVERVERLLVPSRKVVELAADKTSIGLTMVEAVLVDRIPQLFNTVTRQEGRRVWIGEQEAIDFASCNYLGLDLHPEVAAAIPPLVEKWGTHPSWTRAVASPLPYHELEERLSELLEGVPVTVFSAVTLLHIGVLPELAGRGGAILVDQQAHTSMHEACYLAQGKGTRVEIWPHDDLGALESRLRATASAEQRVIAVDGVYSMSGSIVDVRALRELAERYDALLYVDDAHGFGLLGESPGPDAPYGHRGNGVVRFSGLPMDDGRLIYVAGLSKAYSSMGAFVASTHPGLKRLAETTSSFVFSGPVPVASLASAAAGLELNARDGDAMRRTLCARTERFIAGVASAGYSVGRGKGGPPMPIVEVRDDGSLTGAIKMCQALWDYEPAVLLTPCVYPSVPLGQAGLRLQVTAAHSEADIDEALAALSTVRAPQTGTKD